MKLDVVFVCQAGDLEVQAALLAASVRKQCGGQAHLHVIEPIPAAEYGTISPVTRRFLDGLGAKWYQFRNPISDEYKVFNKLNAFNIQPLGDRILFLDSDIIVRRPLDGLQPYLSRPFAAKCGFQQAFSADPEDWKPIYRLFDMPVPAMRWPASDSHEWGPPYFSAAVILVDPALDFSKCLIDTCLTIHRNAEALRLKKLGTAQIGLSVAPFRLNIPCALLDSRFNFALTGRRLKNFNHACGNMVGHIFHYGNASRLLKTPFLLYEAYQLYKSFKLDDIFALLPSWRKLLLALAELEQNPAQVDWLKPHSSFFELPAKAKSFSTGANRTASVPAPDRPAQREVFITEIPHSGGSLFSALLAKLPNVVVAPEPPRAGEAQSFDEWATVVKNWREQIANDRAPTANAVFATQHGAGCLANLEALLKVFPQALVFIAVRNPLAAIADWMNSPALQTAGLIEHDRLAGIHAPALAEDQRQQLAEVQKLEDVAMQRAGLWNYFAGLANTHDERIHIVRHEDMLENPGAVLAFVGETLFPGQNLEVAKVAPPFPEPEQTRTLAKWEVECIRAACSYSAGAFGYNLYASECEASASQN
ncbi:MAG: hypothetical protein ONB46_03160 [candidate division KSB1 bacterium]|nr:hypothetical protein [candidate division KSB1 bacterium]MDZ7365078.1 hypothetical protein [candidate division KSB1 bacterium]MDZ7407254.1 hypothetical protein [candidate division KSB1 bacterium]